mgnify:CR=1 FL=1
MKGRLKQVPKGETFTVDVFDGGYQGKCVHARFGFISANEAHAEIANIKHMFATKGVDDADYLYVVRPVQTCDWVFDEEYIKEIDTYARNLYLKDHDPVDDGLESFVNGFIEGVLAREEELI